MVGLPRSIIKKYGVSKKAWAVFRGTKHSAPRARGKSMVRHRFGRKRRGGGIGGLLSGKGKLAGMIGMGVVGQVIAGYVGAMAADKFMPGNSMVRLGAAFIAGGPIGAGAAFIAPGLPNQILGGLGGGLNETTSSSASRIY